MNKKVLLINPKLPQKAIRLNIPLSLLYLGTWLSHKGYPVNILDAFNSSGNRRFYDRVRDELGSGVLAVGVSVMTAQIASAIEISKFVREFAPSVPIIWGGVHPTLYPEQVARADYVDFVVKGEGEITAVELLEAIENKAVAYDRIKGVAFENPMGEIRYAGGREPVDLDELPSPDLDLVEDVRDIVDFVEVTKRVVTGLPVLTSRGCPHKCAFCISPITKVRYRFRRVGLVIQDLEQLLNRGVTEIYFADEDFFANKKRLIEILDEVERRGLKFRWFGTARADYFRERHINRELLERIKRSGCQQLGIGLESGSQRVLDMIKKGITVEDSLNTARLLDEVGIDASFSFMDGLPDESGSEIRQTLQLVAQVASINNNFRVIGPFVFRPYAGSELYARCLELGMREPMSLEEWAGSPFIGDTIDPKDYPLFSWVQYPMRDLVRLNFYAWMAGLRVRWGWLTKIVRRIGAWRCRRMWFGFPIEMWLLDAFRKLGLDKAITKGKFD